MAKRCNKVISSGQNARGSLRKVPKSIGPNTKPTALELFSGSGGLGLGLRQAGFVVPVAVDCNKHAAVTYRKHHKLTKFLKLDLAEASSRDIFPDLDLTSADIDLIAGGPPCKGFSSANHARRNGDNPLNKLVDHFFRLVLEIRPKAFVMENVMGIVWYNGGYLPNCEHLPKLEAAGYNIQHVPLNGLWYGLPQNRQRFFLIGNRLGKTFRLPKTTHGDNALRSYITLGEAILGDLPPIGTTRGSDVCDYAAEPTSEYQRKIRSRAKKVHNHITTVNCQKVRERIAHVPLGGNWSDVPREFLGIKVKYSSLYKRLDPKKPSVTLGHFRKNMLIHPTEDRLLSLREAARLQGFPDTYRFDGPIDSMQQLIADATPPVLALRVARQILRMLTKA